MWRTSLFVYLLGSSLKIVRRMRVVSILMNSILNSDKSDNKHVLDIIYNNLKLSTYEISSFQDVCTMVLYHIYSLEYTITST